MLYKINPTILNSFTYLESSQRYCEARVPGEEEKVSKYEEQARQFIKQLDKTFVLNTEAGHRGNELESLIEARTRDVAFADLSIKHLAHLNRSLLERNIDEIANIVRGGSWQVKVEKVIQDDLTGDTYLLNGKVDVFSNTSSLIYDIKYTEKRKLYKFENSLQHRLYMLCADVSQFSYLISNGVDWWREDYRRNLLMDTTFILNSIRGMRSWINERPEAQQAFEKHWSLSTIS